MLLEACQSRGIEASDAVLGDGEGADVARLVDRLLGAEVEPALIQPTFLTGHPVVMSPLARADPSAPHRTLRAELFAAGFELCNAYDPGRAAVVWRLVF